MTIPHAPDGTPPSSLSFGCMQFGGTADEAASQAMFRACRARGITMFDTAHVYTDSASETFLGRLVALACWPDDPVQAEGLARHQAAVTVEVTRPLTAGTCLTTFAADRTPIYGRDLHAPDIVWCAGQGGCGFQIAPAMARSADDLLSGRGPALSGAVVAALDPERYG